MGDRGRTVTLPQQGYLTNLLSHFVPHLPLHHTPSVSVALVEMCSLGGLCSLRSPSTLAELPQEDLRKPLLPPPRGPFPAKTAVTAPGVDAVHMYQGDRRSR